MELKNENFKEYMNIQAKDIPVEDMSGMLDELMGNAMYFMNTTCSDEEMPKLTSTIIALFREPEIKHLSMSLIIEAFHKGSLGELGGTTKFGTRNVYIWLKSMIEKNQRLIQERISRQDNKNRKEEAEKFLLNRGNSPLFARAMGLKLNWIYESRRENRKKLISSVDWDFYPVEAIVKLFQEGYDETTIKPSMIYEK